MEIQENWGAEGIRNPFIEMLGVVLEEARPDYARVAKTVEPEDLDDRGTVHDGLYFTLADEVCGAVLDARRIPSVTINAAYQFLGAARAGDRLRAEAREIRSEGALCVYEARIHDQTGRLLGIGTFTNYLLR